MVQVPGNPFDMISITQPMQEVLGIKGKIMLDWDPKGKQGPSTPLPDLVTIHSPKEEEELIQPPPLMTQENVTLPPWTRVLKFHHLLQGDELLQSPCRD